MKEKLMKEKLITTTELVKIVSEKTGKNNKETLRIVKATLESIVEALENKDRVQIRDFGTFSVKIKQSREVKGGINKESVLTKEKQTVEFKAGKNMIERINLQ